MKKPSKDTIIKLLTVAVIVLGAIVIAPHFHPAPAPLLSSSMTDMTNPAMPGMVMASFPLDAADTPATVPTVSFTLTKDSANDGWNLHILTTNFAFTPENENGKPVPNEGHAHLYIDGALSVVYGPWYHIDSLSPGTHTVTVSLNANDHSIFTANGVKIQQVQQVKA